jgi:hypothetical protein
MRKMLIGAAIAALGIAGCGPEQPAQTQAQDQALAPGLYAASWTVTQLRSTDGAEPKTDLTVGSTGSTQACVREGPIFDMALFADGDDECASTTTYVRGGRINIQMQCKRAGEEGPVMQTVSGTYTADGFETEVSSSTYFAGFGDYSMTRTIEGRRIGDCPAQADAEAEES